jgi:hypothetical protein
MQNLQEIRHEDVQRIHLAQDAVQRMCLMKTVPYNAGSDHQIFNGSADCNESDQDNVKCLLKS